MIFLILIILKALTKNWLVLKNLNNQSCIDLFLINRRKYFQNTSTVEIGISDFHKLVETVLKMFYKKQKLKIIQYRNYKTFNEQIFRTELDKELAKIDLSNAEWAFSKKFNDEFWSVLNKRVPVKYIYIRANNSSYMTKSLRGTLHVNFQPGLKFIPSWIQLYLCSKLSSWLHAETSWNFSPKVISTLS